MAGIPLDLQRRCEQRWATRFIRPDSSAPKTNELGAQNQLMTAGKGAKRKTRRVKRAGIRSAPAE